MLDSISLFAKQNRLYLKTLFRSAVGARISDLQGTIICGDVPHFAVNKQVLTFDQIDFTAETRNVLANTAAWLLKPVVVSKLSERLKVDVSRLLQQASVEANRLAGHITLDDPFHLSFVLDHVAVTDLAVRRDSIYADFDAISMARLSYGTPR